MSLAGIEDVGHRPEAAPPDAGHADPAARTATAPGGPAAADTLIEAVGLRKVHPSKGDATPTEAVAGIDFTVRRGQAFGFLGPNGAGKSTTMRMIACVSPVSGGSLRVLGMDPARDGSAIRARLGSVPQDDTLDTELTVRENLLVYGRYFGFSRAVIRERTTQLLEFARLADKADEPVEALSGGMRRRLTIARSLINRPEILLLDEPTTGLDPQARHLLWERLFRLKQQGVTLLLTTHYMDEAEQLCDHIVVMDHGRIVAEGSPADLIRRHSTREVLELRFPVGEQQAAAARLAGTGERLEDLPDRVLVYAEDGEAALAAVHERGVRPLTALVRRAGLEDVFLTLTGRTLVD
ncbi:ABC transporter [Kitasatospora sp. NE20-6]